MLIIRGARVINPAEGTDEIKDIYIADGVFVGKAPEGAKVIDAAGLIAAPGLVDMHVHFREPGFTYKEDIITGAAAAAAGGVTTVVCMPNTKPVIDSAETVEYIANRAEAAAVRVLTYAAVTVGQGGKVLTDFAALKNAGAVVLSDDGNPIMDAEIMKNALLAAKEPGFVISCHSEDADMVQNYAVNEGAVSEKLGIPGRPALAEELMIARDALLALETDAAVHIAHVSTAKSVEIIRQSKKSGAKITAETCPQYFSLTENEVLTRGTMARMNPPLRTVADVDGIIEGLCDGTIDAIATDHAPHSAAEKALPLEDAPSGIVGLETSLALAITKLYHTGRLSLPEIIDKMTAAPSRILGLDYGTLGIGKSADLVLFDPQEEWTVDPVQFKSKSQNTPFAGITLRGRVKYTISRGNIVYEGEK